MTTPQLGSQAVPIVGAPARPPRSGGRDQVSGTGTGTGTGTEGMGVARRLAVAPGRCAVVIPLDLKAPVRVIDWSDIDDAVDGGVEILQRETGATAAEMRSVARWFAFWADTEIPDADRVTNPRAVWLAIALHARVPLQSGSVAVTLNVPHLQGMSRTVADTLVETIAQAPRPDLDAFTRLLRHADDHAPVLEFDGTPLRTSRRR